MGLDFFKRSIQLVEKYRKPGQTILHTIQTNGTKIDDELAAFFKQHNFLVGLSVDGPQPLHDTYRVNKGGSGSFEQVMCGYHFLQKHGVDMNILCTVHAANADHPLEIYHFFRDELKAEYMQFIPIVERATVESLPLANQGWSERPGGERQLYSQVGELVTGRSVKPEQYGRFLIAIFDVWVRRDVGKVFVQSFDAALANWVGQPSRCIFQPTCGNALALEHNGDLYSCDHFVEPAFLLGNIQQTNLIELVASDQQREFGQDKWDSLPKYCRECEVLFACYGDCPRNRFIHTPDGEPGLNYLCSGYKLFFNHINRPMRIMAELLRRYGLTTPVQPAAGSFTDPTLQNLYTELVIRGSQSPAEAIKVGGLIEEIDILDLQERLAQTDNADIQQVYTNLLNGSYNHLGAFANTLSIQTGETYQPQQLSAEGYQAILSNTQGDGNGRGNGRGQDGNLQGGSGQGGNGGNGRGQGGGGRGNGRGQGQAGI